MRSKNQKTKLRKLAAKKGFRSGLEMKVCEELTKDNVIFQYESIKLDYIVPEKQHTYTPDVVLPSGIIVEIKGRWDLADRKKMLCIIDCNPDCDIRMVFQNSKTKLRKGGKMTYGQWCDKHNIVYADKKIPKEWY